MLYCLLTLATATICRADQIFGLGRQHLIGVPSSDSSITNLSVSSHTEGIPLTDWVYNTVNSTLTVSVQESPKCLSSEPSGVVLIDCVPNASRQKWRYDVDIGTLRVGNSVEPFCMTTGDTTFRVASCDNLLENRSWFIPSFHKESFNLRFLNIPNRSFGPSETSDLTDLETKAILRTDPSDISEVGIVLTLAGSFRLINSSLCLAERRFENMYYFEECSGDFTQRFIGLGDTMVGVMTNQCPNSRIIANDDSEWPIEIGPCTMQARVEAPQFFARRRALVPEGFYSIRNDRNQGNPRVITVANQVSETLLPVIVGFQYTFSVLAQFYLSYHNSGYRMSPRTEMEVGILGRRLPSRLISLSPLNDTNVDFEWIFHRFLNGQDFIEMSHRSQPHRFDVRDPVLTGSRVGDISTRVFRMEEMPIFDGSFIRIRNSQGFFMTGVREYSSPIFEARATVASVWRAVYDADRTSYRIESVHFEGMSLASTETSVILLENINPDCPQIYSRNFFISNSEYPGVTWQGPPEFANTFSIASVQNEHALKTPFRVKFFDSRIQDDIHLSPRVADSERFSIDILE